MRPSWIKEKTIRRFLSKLQVQSNPAVMLLQAKLPPAELMQHCWTFTGFLHRNGYSQQRVGSKVFQGHVLSYYLFRKCTPPAKQSRTHVIDHKCNCRACCNPFHLFEMSQQQNILRVEMQGHGVHSGAAGGSIQSNAAALSDLFNKLKGENCER